MNKMWAILFFLLPLAGIAYSSWHVWHLLPLPRTYKAITLGILLLLICCFFANFLIFHIDRWPMPLACASYETGNSAIFVLLYAVLLFIVMDLGRLLKIIPPGFMSHSWQGTLTVVGILVAVFTYGYFNYMHKVRVPLALTTTKPIGRDKKIVMISDLHVGYHNRRQEIATWVDKINAENPDLILICGDVIDGHIRPLITDNIAEELRRLQAPVYACLGNHEYYCGIGHAEQFYKDAGFILLKDRAVCTQGLNIIGRDDRSNALRQPLKQLTHGLDMRRYTILLDHQPYNLEQAEVAGIDFQLSGHTHYGQIWPISWIEDLIYEKAYGSLTKGKTHYYITGGIGIWGGKFRIGTQSEYIVATLSEQ